MEDVAYQEIGVHFLCFDKMNKRDRDEVFGLQPIDVRRVLYFPFPDKPITEEQQRRNLDNERNARLHLEYNDLQQILINILHDKIFLADSLALRVSLISSGALHVPRHGIEYEEENEELPLSERKRSIRNRPADAGLTFETELETLKTLNKVLLSQNIRNLTKAENQIRTLHLSFEVDGVNQLLN